MFPVVHWVVGKKAFPILILILSCFPSIFYNEHMTFTISKNKALNITFPNHSGLAVRRARPPSPPLFLLQTTSLSLRFINGKVGVLIPTAWKDLLKELEE